MSRAKWKGVFIDPNYIKNLNLKKKHQTTLMSRNSKIIPKFIGLTFKVYNGKNCIELPITEEMVGHKFGEFAFTRAKFSFKKKKSKK